jgi:hypothetical protein
MERRHDPGSPEPPFTHLDSFFCDWHDIHMAHKQHRLKGRIAAMPGDETTQAACSNLQVSDVTYYMLLSSAPERRGADGVDAMA